MLPQPIYAYLSAARNMAGGCVPYTLLEWWGRNVSELMENFGSEAEILESIIGEG